ncbi:hypothetical protein [Paenibacillus sediminis]|uniref:Uncharacterized protein n=1 Tax=Paenibacillus sediminis TaxID=664909 RepID=A0ABS4H1U0_9BACL|nr:hypothetical protein [Paenibacillus sediminis]MBP1936496.1 hypothetical protein [Paenibacillus sediminis]
MSITNAAVSYLKEHCELTEMHEMLCYIRLFERLPNHLRLEITEKLNIFIENCVVKNPEDRNGYCAVPLQIMDYEEHLIE